MDREEERKGGENVGLVWLPLGEGMRIDLFPCHHTACCKARAVNGERVCERGSMCVCVYVDEFDLHALSL